MIFISPLNGGSEAITMFCFRKFIKSSYNMPCNREYPHQGTLGQEHHYHRQKIYRDGAVELQCTWRLYWGPQNSCGMFTLRSLSKDDCRSRSSFFHVILAGVLQAKVSLLAFKPYALFQSHAYHWKNVMSSFVRGWMRWHHENPDSKRFRITSYNIKRHLWHQEKLMDRDKGNLIQKKIWCSCQSQDQCWGLRNLSD